MKQRITVEQLNELSDEQKNQLREWWQPKKGDMFYWPSQRVLWLVESFDDEDDTIGTGDGIFRKSEFEFLPLLSIGQMIEFLIDGIEDLYIQPNRNEWQVNHKRKYGSIRCELCDALWETVKQVLSENPQ